MSSVMVLFKVYPKEGSLETALDEIRKKLSPKDIKEEEIGFGIKAIKVLFTYDNANMTSSQIEDSLKRLDSVEEVEVEQESLL